MASHKHIRTWLLCVFCLVFFLICSFIYPQERRVVPEGKIIKEIRFEGLKRTKEYIVTRQLISKVGEALKMLIWELLARVLDIMAECLKGDGHAKNAFLTERSFIAGSASLHSGD
jgi:hypothetical protein